ncbi:hypothetical protein Cgig2_014009 [Carnegiea gigantea]|uniref:non-specific serine/threonine protein kinase n=1 Tax=Carnegiea gigantea TaxID=171969 RepID=A0A9Q1KX55_9CARY|nr:hypothetical protein Cgig2_014009 [Carnegiea gigantea]
MHSGEARLSPPCLTPNHERGKVVFVLITMFVLPVVNCAGSVSASGNKTDHLALLAIKSAIRDPLGALTSWNHSRTISPYIGNLSFLRSIDLSTNKLGGQIPVEIGLLSRLSFLYLFQNLLIGEIPSSISNCLSLKCLSIGKVPWNLGHLKHLQLLRIGNNSLGSGDANDLSFLSSLVNCTNLEILGLGATHFGGVLPHTIANLSSKLIALELHVNMISGRIPAGISHLTSLVRLVLHKNQLSGTIPSEIGNLQKLEIIDLGVNLFSVVIPESLGNLPKLSWLSFEENYFQGYIPSSLGNCQNLINMYVHQNHLSGPIPKSLFKGSPHLVELSLGANHSDGPLPFEVSHQINLVRLVVANNKLSGEIPSVIGGCSSLVFLYLQGNMFHGHIRASLSSLKSLQELDLSHNFSGPIPTYLSKFPLTYLNLSYNYFEGEVPIWGVFGNRSAISLVANPKLCGGILELHLPRCTGKEVTKAKISFKLKLIISCACALIAVAIIGVACSMESLQDRISLKDATAELLKVKDDLIRDGLRKDNAHAFGLRVTCSSEEDEEEEEESQGRMKDDEPGGNESWLNEFSRSHLTSSCLTPGKRHIIVIFVIAMSIRPFVTHAGIASGTSGNETDHLALFAIKSAIKDPLGALNSWNHSVHHCHWEGVVCGRRRNRVVALNLSSKGLRGGGIISPYIGNLSFLHFISLSDNTLGGPIPAEIGFLFRLFGLYLYQNLLTGEIPSTISNCRSLEYLSVAHNSLEGRIPTEFISLSMLKGLYVHENNLSGPIFSAIQKLTSLEELS